VGLGQKPKIAIATGDAAGIGPEISLKAALDPTVRQACDCILVSDPQLLQHHAVACGIAADLRMLDRISDGDWSDDRINVLHCPQPQAAAVPFGTLDPAAGRAALAFASAAIKAALDGAADAVVAAPQNEAAIALAGIKFDGHPSFVARETGTDASGVYLMLAFGETRIAHCTLHLSVKDAVAQITRENVLRVIRTTDRALKQLSIGAPKICVGGLNPHAGEGGLFGREEIEAIKPAIEAAAGDGIAVTGPFGADTLLHRKGFDAFIVMLHDQGHIPAKLTAPHGTTAFTIGTPILFASVAHGSAHDIAGKGIASPKAMIDALLRLSSVRQAHGARK
jgi:4-hydroxythreonine-4-phosphate dehydrogenase